MRRLASLALAFAYFGLGGLVLGGLVVPLAVRLARLRGRSEADRLAQRILHRGTRSFLALIARLGLVRIRWRGAEALDGGPRLIVANHPSLLDTPLFLGRMPQVDFIVSPSWDESFWLRRAMRAAGYLRAGGGARTVQEAAARLRAGRSIVVYPEGSRSPAEGLGRFQRGAAHIALEAGVPIHPVHIHVAPRVLTRSQRLRDYPLEAPVWEVEVGAPIRPETLLDGSEPRPVAARRLTGILHAGFAAGPRTRGNRGER